MIKLRIRVPGKPLLCYELRPAQPEEAFFILRGFSGQLYHFKADRAISADEFWDTFASSISNPVADIDREAYVELVERAISEIETQPELHKVVLSRSSYFSMPNLSPEATFSALERNYSDCTVFAFSHPELGDWMGATPEILLEKTDQGYRSMSLAGTRLKGSTSWGHKELEEQRFVTDEIQATLKKYVPEVVVSAPQTRTAGPVEHVQTWLEVGEPELDFAAVLEDLHPTPAVCGTPTMRAKELIEGLEQYDRQLYTGYLAILGDQPTASVLLRTMKWYNNGVRFFAGGGITKDSVPLDEWKETQHKMAALKDLLCKK